MTIFRCLRLSLGPLIRVIVAVVFGANTLLPSTSLAQSQGGQSQSRPGINSLFLQRLGNLRIAEILAKRSTDNRGQEKSDPTSGTSETGVRSSATEVAVHQAQILVLLIILAGVDVVKQEYQLSGLKNEPTDFDDLMKNCGLAAEHIINSGSTWTAIIGAGAASAASAPGMKLIKLILGDSSSRVIFKQLVQSGIASFITFLGWELGTQLWQQSLYMLPTQQEYTAAQNLKLVLGDLFSQKVLDPSSALLINKIFANMGRILFEDSDLRNNWLYNTWRLKIATGEFATLVTAMVSASVAGTAIFPGAGTLGGLMFGIAGGTLALFIPQKTKDSITTGLQEVRLRLNTAGKLYTNQAEIRDAIRRYNNNVQSLEFIKPGRPERYVSMLNDEKAALKNSILPLILKRSEIRENVVNIFFERIYRSRTKLNKLVGQIQIASQSKNFAAIKDLDRQVADEERTFEDRLSSLREFYRSEQQTIEEIAKSITKYPEFTNELTPVVSRLKILDWSVNQVLEAIAFGDISQREAGTVVLNSFYLEAYTEGRVLRAHQSLFQK